MDSLLTADEFSAGTNGKISASDPRVQPLLDGASAAIRRYCGWHITPVLTETITLDGPGGSILMLPTLNLISVVSFTERGTAANVSELEWSAKGMVRRRHSRWTTRFRGLTVEMEHGYEDAPDVKAIVQQVVANAISSPMGATREQAGQVSISWATTAPGVSGGLSLLERDYAVLDLYRLPKAA